MVLTLGLLIFYGSAVLVSAVLALCIILVARSNARPHILWHKNEEYFLDVASGKKIKFPCIHTKASVNLSVVVPAYNEEIRLVPMLDECIDFLEKRNDLNKNFKYEIIVVSDGSTDSTVKVAQKYAQKYGTDKIRVMELEVNRGKGGAVRLGMLCTRGAVLLFADADGATKFADLVKLEDSLQTLLGCDYTTNPSDAENKLAIVIGSRAHLEEAAIATRSFFRTILMYGFHFLVWLFAVRGLRDTQCGFKVLTRGAARKCFTNLHVERWAFDVEMLYIAQKLKIPIEEVAVTWTEIDGSKVTPVWSWIQMGVDLALIWVRYTIGAWKIVLDKTKKDN